MSKERIKAALAFGRERTEKGDKPAGNTIPVPAGSTKNKKRLGRGIGSKTGKTGGRGSKGQYARNTVRRGFEGGQMPIHRRLPKRGFTSIFHKDFFPINLRDIEKSGLTGNIDAKIMVESKILDKESSLFKILGTGEITKAVHIVADGFSASAKEKIEKAGGSIKLRSELASKEA
ncbi:50S ribosomal protein L15 [Leptospira hartskeerlii]|uniref:Large ribosomal subunit protein uL15 n=1 Tax=Leptospira hartskeerlii TaxID=2023177 RepID=A0A2M9XGC9_9LEPT|nr:50S ribosomal protein L15 [Leptospira hartskeerlii]PJZ26741.1 50S ribosomal protein L15 [Leptospira hartskeerlii]PJZ34777.1 50S ribosomal protein L15 [Leptospira hartskeerlii]